MSFEGVLPWAGKGLEGVAATNLHIYRAHRRNYLLITIWSVSFMKANPEFFPATEPQGYTHGFHRHSLTCVSFWLDRITGTACEI